MSSYTLDLPEIGEVMVTKKKGMKSLRVRISPKGEVLVSAPWYVPKSAVKTFVFEKSDWITKHAEKKVVAFGSGQKFGRSITLEITENNSRNFSRQYKKHLLIKLGSKYDPKNKTQQKYIEDKITDALTVEAEEILLPRLNELAEVFEFDFNQAFVKRLTSRWGSCDQNKNIILNIYLVQLPDDLIDYVILHELVHTKHMNHGSSFWREMERVYDDAKQTRKLLKNYNPILIQRNS